MPRGGFREGAGRPKGTCKPESEKTVYKNFTVCCLPEEYEVLKQKALESGKTISRFLIDLVK